MVGLCGVIGEDVRGIEELVENISLESSEKTTTYRDDRVGVGYADHPSRFETQPAVATQSDDHLWVWGNVLGHEHDGEYEPRDWERSDAEYCRDLYERFGRDFVAGLNSEFAGVVYDPDAGTVSLFTDRLGSRPIYYTTADSGAVVFSSQVQALDAHPGVELKYSPRAVRTFLTYSRTFGVQTLFEETSQIPPGSVVTFDTDGTLVSQHTYWWPTPKERDESFGSFVDRFTETLEAAIRDRLDRTHNAGLLLSGGSDSRRLLDSLGGGVTAFHMNERVDGNREAETAKEAADAVDAEFAFLERDLDYYPTVLERLGPVTNFNGLFRHAHAFGFGDEISDRVDVLFCGQYSDTILAGNYAPTYPPRFDGLEHIFPRSRPLPIRSPEEYVRSLRNGDMGDYNSGAEAICDVADPDEIVSSNVVERNDSVEFHGVSYPSYRSLTEFGMIYPITNVRSFVFYESLQQMLPTEYPYLDNRVVDLALQTPSRYRYRRDVVAASLANSNPELASIPHPRNRLPLGYPAPVKFYAHKATSLFDRVRSLADEITRTGADSEINDDGSYPSHDTLVRTHSFVESRLDAHRDELASSEYIDLDGVQSCYRDHLNGKNHSNELYALVTLLESPIALD